MPNVSDWTYACVHRYHQFSGAGESAHISRMCAPVGRSSIECPGQLTGNAVMFCVSIMAYNLCTACLCTHFARQKDPTYVSLVCNS